MEVKTRQEMIEELEELHKQQRAWQRAVEGETLNYEAIAKLTDKQLSFIIEKLKLS